MTKRRGRLAAFLILSLLATALAFITISSAQSKRASTKHKKQSSKVSKTAKKIDPEDLFRTRRGGPARAMQGQGEQEREEQEQQEQRAGMSQADMARRKTATDKLKPKELRLQRARTFNGDLRSLPLTQPVKRERPERELPRVTPVPYSLTPGEAEQTPVPESSAPSAEPSAPELAAPAPTPIANFDGLDFASWGAGHPPDTNGDVGPTYYIQTVNTSIGIYNKSTGVRVAAFTFDTFMSQGHFGNLCDTDNFGDPVVVYDSFEDRWVISDFAFQLDASDNVINPPGAFQCFAVSKTGDPVSGGWNYYSINTTGGLGDYPKLGIWPDGIYMSVNMFDYAATGAFQNPRVYAFNKAQMYAGAPTVQSVSFDAPSSEFSLLPSNARLQAGTPPSGSPNYFTNVTNFLNVISVYKFHVDWNNISTSTFTGPFDSLNTTWWAQLVAANQTAPTPANRNDELYARLMMQNQYTNIGGVESLWNSMTAGLGNPTTSVTATQSAVRYYQLKVTGGNVETNTSQAFTYSPADTIWRYMPSLAVDRAGNMAIGYTTSNATTHPTLTYAGRLATDPLNSITQTDQTLFAGTGSQSGSCGGTCERWGDYSAMSLDPDGCTFWYTNEYYATNGLNDLTRIGSFKFPQCTPVGNGGTISGTVTANPGGAPLQGATVTLGSRTTTTDASGNYSFVVPAGTYPGMTASFPGRNTATATSIVVTDSNITTRNFSLNAAATSGCLTDTTQADFQGGIPTDTDLATSAGDVILLNAPAVNQKNETETQAFGFSNTSWFGQTFTPSATGQVTKVEVDMFCSSCTGTPPNVVIAIRNASGNLPTGADLASASIPFSNSGSGGFYTATFTSPPTLTGGTQYAIVVRMSAAYATGTPAYATSTTSAYAGGRRTTSANSGTSWTGTTPDIAFRVTMKTGFKASGDFVSSLKDANPSATATANWGTFSWTATAPAGTTLKFQVAASNNVNGPFSYVGPDGTASTFYTTSGGSLSQFNGKRYLRYKALFTGTSTATPTLNDVTVCFNDVASIVTTTLAAAPATGTYGGTVNLSATLTDGTNGISGKSIAFTLNGNSVGSGTTNASGVATVSNVSLSGINAGSYPTGVGASFAGDSGNTASSSTAALTVNKANQTITFGTLADKTYGDADFSVSATASSGLAVSFNATGNCTASGNTVHITGAGSCTITASQGGDTNYNAAPNVGQSFNIAKAATTTTVTVSNATYDGNPHGGMASVTGPVGLNQGVTVSYTGRNSTVYGPSTTAPTGGGDYTASATFAGDSNYLSSSDSKDYQITKASQTITFNPLADKTYGDADFSVSATASSGLAVSFNATGNCSVTGSTVHLTGAGSCTITASQAGDSNYSAATDVSRSFQIAKGTATITLSNLSHTYDGTAKSATATTNPAGLSVVITYSPNPSANGINVVSGNPVNAGSYTVTATIDDPNYEGTATDTLVISKANATINVTGFVGVYDGQPHGATGTATGTQSEDLSGLLHLGDSFTNVPGGTASWTFDSNSNYNSDSGTATITITKATPAITWNNPADIIYGTALSGTQLNATANTPGAFTYTPAAGTVLGYGNGQNLHVDFVPTDTTNYANASKNVSINVLGALLSTTMTVDRNPALVGYNHNYKIAVTNNGTAAATSMTLSDPLPSQVRYTAVTTSQGSCSYNTGTHTINCNLGTLGTGATANIQITTKTLQEGTLNNTATVTASQWDASTGGNTASVNGLQAVAQVDVSISKTDTVDPIFVGDTTTYTLLVKNQDTPINATGIVVTDNLPASMTFVSATTTQGSLVTPPVGSTGIVTANLGTIAPNATATVTITVAGTAAGAITNTATVSANEADAVSANNTASQTTTVKPLPSATLQKVLLASQVLTGGCDNTTGNVYLTAPAPAGGVTVNLSSNISGATVPASVFIPAGQTVSPAFNVTSNVVPAKQVGLITATLGAQNVSRGITINKGNGTCPP